MLPGSFSTEYYSWLFLLKPTFHTRSECEITQYFTHFTSQQIISKLKGINQCYLRYTSLYYRIWKQLHQIHNSLTWNTKIKLYGQSATRPVPLKNLVWCCILSILNWWRILEVIPVPESSHNSTKKRWKFLYRKSTSNMFIWKNWADEEK